MTVYVIADVKVTDDRWVPAELSPNFGDGRDQAAAA